ncbi:HMG box protein [Cordyceps javanica]|uniref:HMG box protein n=1 Tax=Cordyceps javanica TaxID=43265 RepID=A0A545V2S7_9HYPO|nr:HMG box protein [Cordyceps javanica]TQW06776.1 HMG box protein [Cordyceps javanica]
MDVTTFAKRSVEVRQKEKAKNGKVKRPLNAFMLYRKAYQDVAKTQCTRNNHQQVSTICGSSWNNWEPPSIITQFRDLAKIEKEMHEAAFPEYKYDPVQAKKPGDGISRNSKTCGLGEGESNCRRRRSGRQQVGRGTSRARPPFPFGPQGHGHGLQIPYSRPAVGPWPQDQGLPSHGWHAPGRLPADAFQYVPRGPAQSSDGLDTAPSYACAASALPLQLYPTHVDSCVDPSLPVEGPGPQYAQFLGTNHDMLSDWVNGGGAQDASTTLVPGLDITDPGTHTAYLQGVEGDWQVEQLEEGSHFSDWMTQAASGEQQ